MAALLRKSSTGAFSHIPFDVFMHILQFLEPREVAKLSLVCKYWKFLVSDNQLWLYLLQKEQNQPGSWDSLVFAETHLQMGYPLLTFNDQMPQLPFMHIFGRRAKAPGAIIIDGGSGYCKYGWSKYDTTTGMSATFLVSFLPVITHSLEVLRNSFLKFGRSIEILVVFPDLIMHVKPSAQPIVLSVPICHYDDNESAKASRRQLKETIHSVLFDMNVPAVCAINQATLALYAAKQTSGIVVNIGFHCTSIVPILHGKVMRKVGVEVVGMGGLKLTGFLRERMQQQNMNFESLYTVRSLKENLCYVAADYEAELSKDTRASFQVASEGWFTLSRERFQTGEILFQPRMAGVTMMGLHQAVAHCMDHCQSAAITADESWFKTVVLAGGSACLPGLAERLEKELHGLVCPSVANGIRVLLLLMVKNLHGLGGKDYQQFEHLPWELVYDKEAVPTQGETQPHGDNI
ncbi:Actin-related protein 8 [Vitis vinifera]|uniref:Actin-related protein 8 n=1 Tax=Vitis vinifera TaxID=29760 RepID=A0A438CPR6_VITVI|nr:Actin-related protein 8 [Vitis vinifera]